MAHTNFSDTVFPLLLASARKLQEHSDKGKKPPQVSRSTSKTTSFCWSRISLYGADYSIINMRGNVGILYAAGTHRSKPTLEFIFCTGSAASPDRAGWRWPPFCAYELSRYTRRHRSSCPLPPLVSLIDCVCVLSKYPLCSQTSALA
jgi:hypothetical protein